MGLILAGRRVEVDGVAIADYLDDKTVWLSSEDRRARQTSWVRSVVVHTTVGDLPQVLRAGYGPAGRARELVQAQRGDGRHAAQHIVIDSDGTAICSVDLVDDVAYHATTLNEVSIGIELEEQRLPTGELAIYQAQLQALVRILDVITRELGIQRQYHAPYHGEAKPVPRLAAGGHDCVGIFGHRDQTIQRGPGDPGDYVYTALRDAGYEPFDFAKDEDLSFWRLRQRVLIGRGAELVADGVPGPATVAALKTYADPKLPRGLRVFRPGD